MAEDLDANWAVEEDDDFHVASHSDNDDADAGDLDDTVRVPEKSQTKQQPNKKQQPEQKNALKRKKSSSEKDASAPATDAAEKKPMSEKKKAKLQALKEKRKRAKTSAAPADASAVSPSKDEIQLLEPVVQAQVFSRLYEQGLTENDIKLSSLEEQGALGEEHFLTVPESLHSMTEVFPAIKAAVPHWFKLLCEPSASKGDDSKKATASSPAVGNGSPTLLVVTPSALRAVEIIRGLRKMPLKSPVAKLFARHMTVEEQAKQLAADVKAAVGTPARLLKLADMGALQMERLAVLVIDMGRDQKKFNMMTMKDVRKDFFKLYHSYLHSRVVEAKLLILLL